MSTPEEPLRQDFAASIAACAEFLPGDRRSAYAGRVGEDDLVAVLSEPSWGLAVPQSLRTAIEELQDAVSPLAMRNEPDFGRFRNAVAAAIETMTEKLARISQSLDPPRAAADALTSRAKQHADAAKQQADAANAGPGTPLGQAADSASRRSTVLADARVRLEAAAAALQRMREAFDADDNASQIMFRLRGLHAEAQRIDARKWSRMFGAMLCACLGFTVWFASHGFGTPRLLTAMLTDAGSVAIAAVCAVLSLSISLARHAKVEFDLRHWRHLSPDGNAGAGSTYALRERPPSVGWMWNLQHRFAHPSKSPIARFARHVAPAASQPDRRPALGGISPARRGWHRVRATTLMALGAVGAFSIGYFGKERLIEPVHLVVADAPALGARCQVVSGLLLARGQTHAFVANTLPAWQWPVPGLPGAGRAPVVAVPLDRVEREVLQSDQIPSCTRAPLDALASNAVAMIGGGTELGARAARSAAKRLEELAVTLVCVQSRNRQVPSPPRDLLLGGHVDASCGVSSEEMPPASAPAKR